MHLSLAEKFKMPTAKRQNWRRRSWNTVFYMDYMMHTAVKQWNYMSWCTSAQFDKPKDASKS